MVSVFTGRQVVIIDLFKPYISMLYADKDSIGISFELYL